MKLVSKPGFITLRNKRVFVKMILLKKLQKIDTVTES